MSALVAKVIGVANHDPTGLAITNGAYRHVAGADLGAVTLYQGRWYFALGDTDIHTVDAVGRYQFRGGVRSLCPLAGPRYQARAAT